MNFAVTETLAFAIYFKVSTRYAESIESGIAVMGTKCKRQKNTDICIPVGCNSKSFGGATNCIFDYLFSVIGFAGDGDIRFTFAE